MKEYEILHANRSSLIIEEFSNADCSHDLHQKSTGGYLFKLDDGEVSCWKKQT